MRPTGMLHIGHWEGVIRNWVELQAGGNDCFFFSADWHMLTTEYENIHEVGPVVRENVADWIACGVDPAKSTIFVQSRVKETAELFLLLQMITGVSMLQNNPTYKEQLAQLNVRIPPDFLVKVKNHIQKRLGIQTVEYSKTEYSKTETAELTEKERHSRIVYGNLDAILNALAEGQYKDDQVATTKALQEIKSFIKPELFERLNDYVTIKNLNTAGFLLYPVLQTADIILYKANAVPVGQDQLPHIELSREIVRKFNTLYPGKNGKPVFPEPMAKLTPVPKLLGLDGRKMSKSYNNAIMLSDSPDEVVRKLKPMKTDEKRQRLTDPGEPNDCNVYSWHELYSSKPECETVATKCRGAIWGCMECKTLLAENLNKRLDPVREKRAELLKDPAIIEKVIAEGSEKAAAVARDTLKDVREAMKIG